ncbi:hypothetical protein [Aquimarina litoralis]|uniref:hypothetical protein n=1 Tax=Aquimarina litoralis TaxID=584605 RepID=UPI001C56FC69|nr:hypothetical protein [Aquimarina litoralis]MBW1299040.1 hypothetical protein [Aquimarina litoralis]
MNLYQRYIQGETKAVYDDIYKLGTNAFEDSYRKEIEKVMTETFERVLFNLNIIYKELIDIGYLFKTDATYNFEKPLHHPLKNTDSLLKQLEFTVKDFGFIPLSLKYFYQIVGGVNFVWDVEKNKNLMWNMADPIQVASLDSVVKEVTTEYWKEDIQQYVDDDYFGCAFLDVAADDLHKDNISGGQPYAIEITKQPMIDARFMNEPNETTFISYLRICFDHCGFPGITRSDMNNDYQKFFEKVKPQLKKI